jgi:hypothetical protein
MTIPPNSGTVQPPAAKGLVFEVLSINVLGMNRRRPAAETLWHGSSLTRLTPAPLTTPIRNIRTVTDRCGIFTALKEIYSGSAKDNPMQW